MTTMLMLATGLSQEQERLPPFPSLPSSRSTLNFGERILIRLNHSVYGRSETQCLILAPTRELALQIQKVNEIVNANEC